MPDVTLPVRWFDGERALPQAARLRWADAQLHLVHDGGQRSYAARHLAWPDASQHRVRHLALPDGSLIECQDCAAWDAWRAGLGLPMSWVDRWSAHRFGPALAVLLSFALILALWRWALPVAADQAALWVSPSTERQLGDRVWREVDAKWLQPSRLSKAQENAAWAALAPVLALAGPEIRVSFRHGSKDLGPNAFALPGGQIVITDRLIELLTQADGSVHPALAGVLAHEIGHVQHRHGLRSVFRSAAASAMAGLWLGDYSALLAAAPVVFAQASYSRDAEREADAHARALMQRAQIDPRAMVHFFAQLAVDQKGRDGDTTYLGLSSHPADNERIRYFEQSDQSPVAEPSAAPPASAR